MLFTVLVGTKIGLTPKVGEGNVTDVNIVMVEVGGGTGVGKGVSIGVLAGVKDRVRAIIVKAEETAVPCTSSDEIVGVPWAVQAIKIMANTNKEGTDFMDILFPGQFTYGIKLINLFQPGLYIFLSRCPDPGPI